MRFRIAAVLIGCLLFGTGCTAPAGPDAGGDIGSQIQACVSALPAQNRSDMELMARCASQRPGETPTP
jgi:hypothetical protein